MKKMKLVYVSLLIISLAYFSTLSIGAEMKRTWMRSACYKFNLTAWDKFSDEAYVAKYKITSSKGEAFIAERNATDSNSAMVVFPDDFHDAKAKDIKASVDCFHGDKYTWEIYVEDILIDSGTIGFTRNKPRNTLK